MKMVVRIPVPFLEDRESAKEMTLDLPRSARLFDFKVSMEMRDLGTVCCRLFVFALVDSEELCVPRRFLVVRENVRVPDGARPVGGVVLPDGQVVALMELEDVSEGLLVVQGVSGNG